MKRKVLPLSFVMSVFVLFLGGIWAVVGWGCGPKKGQKGMGTTSRKSAAHPPLQPIEVKNPEGNLLLPDSVYSGSWTLSEWYTFKFALKKMGAFQFLATSENEQFGKVDFKISQMGEEFYTSMTSADPRGPQRVRLPEGEYKVTIVISVDGDPQRAGRWTLSVSELKGKEALAVPVPPAILRKVQEAFPGGIHRLTIPPTERPTFDFIMESWLWPGTPKKVVYARESVPLFGFDASPLDVLEGRGVVLQLAPGEPVIVYDLVDIFAVRVYTADGLDGIAPASAFVKEAPPMVNPPSTMRLAPPNMRKVAPPDAGVQSNAGLLALLYHPALKKHASDKKVVKCLTKVKKEQFEAFLKAFESYSSLPPWEEKVDQKAQPAVAAWKSFATARDSCLAKVWEKAAPKMDHKVKTEACFVVLNMIRKSLGADEVPIPSDLPAVFPATSPPVQPATSVPPGQPEVIGPSTGSN